MAADVSPPTRQQRRSEKARNTSPPKSTSASTDRNTRPLVIAVRESVWLIASLVILYKESRRCRRRFSRIRSNTTIVSFTENPTSVSSAAITFRLTSIWKIEKKPGDERR